MPCFFYSHKCHHYSGNHSLLLRVEVVQKDVALLAFLSPVSDHDARAVDDFARVAFAIDLAWVGVC